MGLGLGLPTGATCTVLSEASTTTPVGAAAQLSGTADAGAYCVEMYDVGNQTAPVTYTVTVVHP